jgi:hypothetical protein
LPAGVDGNPLQAVVPTILDEAFYADSGLLLLSFDDQLHQQLAGEIESHR